ncbi:hypothetical protein Mp_2g04370 [Marchantia polymorpha subsp. ruderalis]|uniref:ATP-dependent 6-phosphofructokinase n=1 Tax=Marchantia polymorpha TaxID=3197 RepID=A0A2R6X7Q4_MARPO|nr:hypothetical protein MARPO_0031s0093 [Marchantia polymorpha]BBN01073.1 hypothetical protein Mp_2g04370 [Marchantia polymorpha subsp. ruderalis]|eukprot:PTQ42123.1 hypothetical protein MARPO_0031s0093 [Marchantia polymorpha]
MASLSSAIASTLSRVPNFTEAERCGLQQHRCAREQPLSQITNVTQINCAVAVSCDGRSRTARLQRQVLLGPGRGGFWGSSLGFQTRRMALTRRTVHRACSRAQATDEAVLEDVPHVTDWLPDLPSFPNPLQDNPAYTAVKQYFVEEDDVVAKNVVVKLRTPGEGTHFRRAGPRQKVYFKPDEVRACIVTCGGLCPGLNTVIREIVCGLWTQYGVRDILGIDGGYAGFYSNNTIQLTPKLVNDIHKRGGTILGTSRGGHDKTKIVAAIQDRGINQVYIIGGDGTQRGAAVIYEELKRRGVKVVVAGIPKTIDNDIAIIDKSFGFDTAVEEAQRAINAAHVEAESVKNGVGLVKLMGRYSGYIAMYATLASRDVDCCLIPEVPFYLEGAGGLYEFVRKRLRENGHMVIVVAEGAGQELIAESTLTTKSDASGNRLLLDVGLWLCQSLKENFAEANEPLTLKYIDPTYMIRAIPSNASDNVYCTLLAHSAIHGAMAGFTGFTVGPVNGRHAYIPILAATETQNRVNVNDRMWARLLSSTNQPDFLSYERVIEGKKAAKAAASVHKFAKVASNGMLPIQEKKTNGGVRDEVSVQSGDEKSKDAKETNVGAGQKDTKQLEPSVNLVVQGSSIEGKIGLMENPSVSNKTAES